MTFTVKHFEDEGGNACIAMRYGVHKCSWKEKGQFKLPPSSRKALLNGSRYQATDALLDDLNQSGNIKSDDTARDDAHIPSYTSSSHRSASSTTDCAGYSSAANSDEKQTGFESCQSVENTTGSEGPLNACGEHHTASASSQSMGNTIHTKSSNDFGSFSGSPNNTDIMRHIYSEIKKLHECFGKVAQKKQTQLQSDDLQLLLKDITRLNDRVSSIVTQQELDNRVSDISVQNKSIIKCSGSSYQNCCHSSKYSIPIKNRSHISVEDFNATCPLKQLNTMINHFESFSSRESVIL